jgi:hypothetical protein
MADLATDVAKKGLALGILLLAAYVLFKVVLGIVSTIVWIAVVVIALIGVVWAIRAL